MPIILTVPRTRCCFSFVRTNMCRCAIKKLLTHSLTDVYCWPISFNSKKGRQDSSVCISVRFDIIRSMTLVLSCCAEYISTTWRSLNTWGPTLFLRHTCNFAFLWTAAQWKQHKSYISYCVRQAGNLRWWRHLHSSFGPRFPLHSSSSTGNLNELWFEPNGYPLTGQLFWLRRLSLVFALR